MSRRIGFALLTAVPLLLIAICAARLWSCNGTRLPHISEPPKAIADLSCDGALAAARQLTKGGALDHAQLAYLWIVEHCDDSSVLPDALLEAGSLFGHLLGARVPTLGRALNLPEILLDIRREGDEFVFAGGGFGHGIGLSQWGAKNMASKGFAVKDILAFYYRNTELTTLKP